MAVLGGEFFLEGVLGLGVRLRLPTFLVTATLAAFATSCPELPISTLANLADRREIGLSDALGSNVVNIASIRVSR